MIFYVRYPDYSSSLTAERANWLRHGDLYIEDYKTNAMLEKW